MCTIKVGARYFQANRSRCCSLVLDLQGEMLARKITLKHFFDGPPTLGDFELVEEMLPDTLQNGGI
jgi:hypothetical protein